MPNLKDIYKQLTSVDIDAQQRLWDERGKGYYGEFLLFCNLYTSIDGTYKILMNLDIPVDDSHTTEIDLLLIHETGLYVFEIKHYQGTIYGKSTDNTWTQYFKTVKNNTFKNPILQNDYHIQALKKLFPDLPIKSIIVFTNDDCSIKVTNTNSNIDICQLNDVVRTLSYHFQEAKEKLLHQEIEDLFDKLTPYSKMQELVKIDSKEAPFALWLQPIITELESKKRLVEQEKDFFNKRSNDLKKAKIKCIFFGIMVSIICIIASTVIIFGFKTEYNLELEKFKQKFLHIDEIDNEYIDKLNSYVSVSNVSLTPLSDDAVSFTARIATTNDVYGVALTESSKYIVMTKSGMTYEYNVFGEHLAYNWSGNRIGTGIRSYGDLAKVQFYGISDTNEISYIKITDIELFKLDISRTLIKNELEIELYSNQ